MLVPPTFGVPVTIPDANLLNRKRWSLWGDRLTCESQDFLWGWSPDFHVMLADVRMVYRYHKARPQNLAWALVSIPAFLVAWFSSPGSPTATAFFSLVGLIIVGLAALSGFTRKPHVKLVASTGAYELRMDRPWIFGNRTLFFNGLALILDIPNLVTGGGLPRRRPRPAAMPVAEPLQGQPAPGPLPLFSAEQAPSPFPAPGAPSPDLPPLPAFEPAPPPPPPPPPPPFQDAPPPPPPEPPPPPQPGGVPEAPAPGFDSGPGA